VGRGGNRATAIHANQQSLHEGDRLILGVPEPGKSHVRQLAEQGDNHQVQPSLNLVVGESSFSALDLCIVRDASPPSTTLNASISSTNDWAGYCAPICCWLSLTTSACWWLPRSTRAEAVSQQCKLSPIHVTRCDMCKFHIVSVMTPAIGV